MDRFKGALTALRPANYDRDNPSWHEGNYTVNAETIPYVDLPGYFYVLPTPGRPFFFFMDKPYEGKCRQTSTVVEVEDNGPRSIIITTLNTVYQLDFLKPDDLINYQDKADAIDEAERDCN